MATVLIILITLPAIALGCLVTWLVVERINIFTRLAAGSVIGLAALSWVGYLTAIIFGLNAISISVTAVIFILALSALIWIVSPSRIAVIFKDLEVSKTSIIYYALWSALLVWLFSRVVMFYPDGLYTAPANNYGDLPFHMGIVTAFAYGENLPPVNPIFAGTKFTYPFLIDFLTAFYIRCGANWPTAFFIENIILSLALIGLIETLALYMTGNRVASRIAPLIFLFNGGLGFINFFLGLGNLKTGLIEFVTHLPQTYTMNADLNSVPLRWGNVFTTLLIPQRSMLFGLPIVAMILILWWMALGKRGEWESGRVGERESGRAGERESGRAGERESARVVEKERSLPESTIQNSTISRTPTLPLSHSPTLSPLLLASGILAGMLPMLHAHGFFAVMIASVVMLLLFRSREWVSFFVPCLLLSLPQVWWLSGTPVKNRLFTAHLGWEASQLDQFPDGFGLSAFLDLMTDGGMFQKITVFWAINAGVFIMLLVAALTIRKISTNRQRRFYLPFVLWFVVPNIVLLAPWPWDNIKVLVYWSLVSCPLVAAVLAHLFTQKIAGRALAFALLLILTFSGALDVIRALSPVETLNLFGTDELVVAGMLRANTPPHSVILHAPIHNSVVALTG
ncbi:MAG: hypothetical protein L0220_21125, partial [Acidobacteria bacterium]|nr:hypothetical protein [Acidobacteriota bacterium]